MFLKNNSINLSLFLSGRSRDFIFVFIRDHDVAVAAERTFTIGALSPIASTLLSDGMTTSIAVAIERIIIFSSNIQNAVANTALDLGALALGGDEGELNQILDWLAAPSDGSDRGELNSSCSDTAHGT